MSSDAPYPTDSTAPLPSYYGDASNEVLALSEKLRRLEERVSTLEHAFELVRALREERDRMARKVEFYMDRLGQRQNLD